MEGVALSDFLILFSSPCSAVHERHALREKSSIFEMSEATRLGDLKCVEYNDFTLFKIAVFSFCINVNSYVSTVACIHYVQRISLYLWMSIYTYIYVHLY